MNRERIVKLRDRLKTVAEGYMPVNEYNLGMQYVLRAVGLKLDALLEICEACDGSGKSNYGPNVYGDDVIYKCPRCNGTGKEAK